MLIYVSYCKRLTFTIITITYRCNEARNSQVRKPSYETKLRKMTSHFELLTRKFLLHFYYIPFCYIRNTIRKTVYIF